jgi:hypothetical protein
MAIALSMTNIPWDPPNPRIAVLGGRLVRQETAKMRALGIK